MLLAMQTQMNSRFGVIIGNNDRFNDAYNHFHIGISVCLARGNLLFQVGNSNVTKKDKSISKLKHMHVLVILVIIEFYQMKPVIIDFDWFEIKLSLFHSLSLLHFFLFALPHIKMVYLLIYTL